MLIAERILVTARKGESATIEHREFVLNIRLLAVGKIPTIPLAKLICYSLVKRPTFLAAANPSGNPPHSSALLSVGKSAVLPAASPLPLPFSL